MVGRLAAVVLGLAGGVAGSQAPGYTLQYMQNLTGRVDELRIVVDQYDGVVRDLGSTREGYVGDLRAARRESTERTAGVIEETYARYETLSAHLAELQGASEYARPLVLARTYKPDIAESVMTEFKPAMPATMDGAAYAGGGFGVVWGALSFFFGAIGAMTGRRRYA